MAQVKRISVRGLTSISQYSDHYLPSLHHLSKSDFTHHLIWVSSFHSLSGFLGSPLLSFAYFEIFSLRFFRGFGASRRPATSQAQHFLPRPLCRNIIGTEYDRAKVLLCNGNDPRPPPGSLEALLLPRLLNKVQNKGTQGARARYSAELHPFISIVRYPGRPVILGMDIRSRFLGRGCDTVLFSEKKGVFSDKGGGNSVNEGFGKDFYRKGNSVKRSGPFSEPPDSEN